MKGRITGLAILVLVIASAVVYQTLLRPKFQKIAIDGYLGGEKSGLFEDERFTGAMLKNYGFTLHYKKAGSIDMISAPLEGMDYLFPSSFTALELYKQKYGSAYKRAELVFNSPIVLYTRKTVAEALKKQGWVRTEDETEYIDLPKLIEAVSTDTKWSAIGLFDIMFDHNKEYFKELEVYIAAGELKVKELTGAVIPELKRRTEGSGDPIAAQQVNDMVQMINRFEKKVHDLKLSKTISLQMAPQIRLVQNNNRILVDKIQTSILNTIPLWKNQIIIAMGIFKQAKALNMQKEVDKMTNDLLLKNSQMLKETTTSVAGLGEKGIVEIETLKKVNTDLIATLEETITIQERGREARKSAELELVKIESELRNKLVEIKNPAVGGRGALVL